MLLGRELRGAPARLDGYRKISVRLGRFIYPDIEPQSEGHVLGIVFSVTDREIEVFDAYEERDYIRVRVVLSDTAPAWVYCSRMAVEKQRRQRT